MRPSEWSGDELVDALLAPVEPPFAGSTAVLTSAPTPGRRLEQAVRRLSMLPAIVLAGPAVRVASAGLDLVDAVATDDDELEALVTGAGRAPIAAQAAAVLLRGSLRRSVEDGLVAESAVFSALQAGPEHRAWRSLVSRRRDADPELPRVRVERRGDSLLICLVRPGSANALDVAMRDGLLEALAVLEADRDLRGELRGDGAVFCSGGDLDEFGTTPDPATAHLVRLRRSVGAALARVADRVTVMVQGATAGSGVELAAFAGRVVAHPAASFVLPELGLGLLPGAGGTVSLPRRIGRHRTATLALTGRELDASTARSWGLVDEIELF